MPAVKIDDSQLKSLAADAAQAPRLTREQAKMAVKGVSFAVEKKVKIGMPVDTGRARASWGHWNSSDLKRANPDASAGDAIWREEDDGLTIVQGSNVEYIEDLNSGSSRQAPAGFIDRAANMGGIQLEVKLGFLDPLSKEYAMRIFEET